jgi:HAD superfamily hydrolase (TIGR01509 family)
LRGTGLPATSIRKPLNNFHPQHSLKTEMAPLPTRLTAILFDLDDTLFDHTATARASLRASAAPLPFFQNLDFEPFYQLYSELLEEYHALLMAGRCTYDEARRLRFERLLAPYWPAATAADVDDFVRTNQRHYPLMRQPVAGARTLLQALKPHYRIGIVTNNRTAEQEEKLAFLGMTDLVDALITSEDVGVPKPDPRIFEVALQRLGARPEQAVLVGDNWGADVLGALAVGIRPVWLNRSGAASPSLQVAEINGFEPLKTALRAITAGER